MFFSFSFRRRRCRRSRRLNCYIRLSVPLIWANGIVDSVAPSIPHSLSAASQSIVRKKSMWVNETSRKNNKSSHSEISNRVAAAARARVCIYICHIHILCVVRAYMLHMCTIYVECPPPRNIFYSIRWSADGEFGGRSMCGDLYVWATVCGRVLQLFGCIASRAAAMRIVIGCCWIFCCCILLVPLKRLRLQMHIWDNCIHWSNRMLRPYAMLHSRKIQKEELQPNVNDRWCCHSRVKLLLFTCSQLILWSRFCLDSSLIHTSIQTFIPTHMHTYARTHWVNESMCYNLRDVLMILFSTRSLIF